MVLVQFPEITMRAWTIGHSNRSLESFIDLLQLHEIEMLVDVRGGRAGSRTFPHFNTEALQESVPAAGVKYQRIPELGGRRGKCKEADDRNDAWRLPAFKNYADYASFDPTFTKGLNELIKLIGKHRVAYMCSEAVPWRCHRSIITDHLVLLHHAEILDITGTPAPKQTRTHDFARVDGSHIIYPSDQGKLL